MSSKLFNFLHRFSMQFFRRSKVTWNSPPGYMSNISVYNIATKTLVPFIIKKHTHVTWYMCGPTVYDSAHLGHACDLQPINRNGRGKLKQDCRDTELPEESNIPSLNGSTNSFFSCYVRFDIIRRILMEYFNLNIVFVMGITDIDDKIIVRAKELNKNITELSNHYETEFYEDMSSLNILPPSITTKVTEYVSEIISFVVKLVKNGDAYVSADGSVYFDVQNFKQYGKLFPINMEEHIIDGQGKKCSRDFALWKASKPGEPFWISPFGKGRPGWHIECSAMASAIFGDYVDLHSGGVDLLFPHHENEEAQSCAYHNVSQWVNYWMHSGHLHLKDSGKMSKSLHNTVSVREFLNHYTADEFRMFCLLSHYRTAIEYNNDTMNSAVAVTKKVKSFLEEASNYVSGVSDRGVIDESHLLTCLAETKEQLLLSLANDFDTAKGLSVLLNLISTGNKMLNQNIPAGSVLARCPAAVAAVSTFVSLSLSKLGLQLNQRQPSSQELLDSLQLQRVIDSSVQFRESVRKISLANFRENEQEGKILLKACDDFREKLLRDGVKIKDYQKSSSWTIVKDLKRKE